MSRLTRDGTAEPVSRDQIIRHARGQGNIIFPVQLTTSRIGNLTRLIHTLLYVMTIHTYIYTSSIIDPPLGGRCEWHRMTRMTGPDCAVMCNLINIHTTYTHVCVCFLPIHSGHQVRWTYQPGSHRRKVTQDFSSTFFLRCVPYFFSREGFSHSFPSSTAKSNSVY